MEWGPRRGGVGAGLGGGVGGGVGKGVRKCQGGTYNAQEGGGWDSMHQLDPLTANKCM